VAGVAAQAERVAAQADRVVVPGPAAGAGGRGEKP
jgi:hypothetical protein